MWKICVIIVPIPLNYSRPLVKDVYLSLFSRNNGEENKFTWTKQMREKMTVHKKCYKIIEDRKQNQVIPDLDWNACCERWVVSFSRKLEMLRNWWPAHLKLEKGSEAEELLEIMGKQILQRDAPLVYHMLLILSKVLIKTICCQSNWMSYKTPIVVSDSRFSGWQVPIFCFLTLVNLLMCKLWLYKIFIFENEKGRLNFDFIICVCRVLVSSLISGTEYWAPIV